MRFRAVGEEEPKYLGVSGLETRLFNLRSLDRADDLLCITEGEIDAISVEAAGVPAVGVPGVESWKRHHRRLFAGVPRVLVLGDNDKAGRAFAKRLLNELENAVCVTLPQGVKDANQLLQEEGPDALAEQLGLPGSRQPVPQAH